MTEYNLAISEVHYRKGSLLEYNSVMLAEGPWPSKAYFDAQKRAREMDGGYYLNYGVSRPAVVSRGGADSQVDFSSTSSGVTSPRVASPAMQGNVDPVWDGLQIPDTSSPVMLETLPPIQSGDAIYGTLGL